jgi:hypothetical protein
MEKSVVFSSYCFQDHESFDRGCTAVHGRKGRLWSPRRFLQYDLVFQYAAPTEPDGHLDCLLDMLAACPYKQVAALQPAEWTTKCHKGYTKDHKGPIQYGGQALRIKGYLVSRLQQQAGGSPDIVHPLWHFVYPSCHFVVLTPFEMKTSPLL